jgi:hypothetical protein
MQVIEYIVLTPERYSQSLHRPRPLFTNQYASFGFASGTLFAVAHSIATTPCGKRHLRVHFRNPPPSLGMARKIAINLPDLGQNAIGLPAHLLALNPKP